MMVIELFSFWGGRHGRLTQRKDGYQVSAMLGARGIWYTGTDPKRLERAFQWACRRAILNSLLPFLSPPPGRLSV